MGTLPTCGGKAGSTTTTADPDVLHGALLVLAAAAGLVLALTHRGSREDACNEPASKSPDTSKRSIPAAAQAGYF